MTLAFNILESSVAEELGLSRERVAKLRRDHLSENADWGRAGNWIAYSEAGRDRLRTLLALPASVCGKEGAAVEAVVDSHPHNKRLLLAKLDTATVRVRVREDQRPRLQPGTPILIRPLGDPASGLFELAPDFKKKGPAPAADSDL
jgi:hypothetical protein